MMRLRSFLLATALPCAVFLSLSIGVNAASQDSRFENINGLRENIQTFVDAHFRAEFGEARFERDIRLRVSQLDQRLKLARCTQPINFELIRPAHQGRNVTVKTRCEAKQRWSIYVPVTLEIFEDVIVASRNLGRGTVIEADDVKLMRINTAGLPVGYVIDKSRVVGMELKRSTRTGSYLLLSSLEQPRVVNKGDAVVVESRLSSLSVSTRGTALDNGQVGEQIKVRNNKSERVVDALVTGPGRVVVVSR